MNNTGNDSPDSVQELTDTSPQPRRVPTRIIVMGLIAVVFALVIGSQVIGILYAIFFPPAAPIPDEATLISHTSKDYGVDDWLYSSNKPACDVVRFYVEKQGQCRISPVWCQDTNPNPPAEVNNRGQNVARCESTQNFSIFALRWEVVIATGSSLDQVSQFRLNREIYWTGAVPPNIPPSLDSEFLPSATATN